MAAGPVDYEGSRLVGGDVGDFGLRVRGKDVNLLFLSLAGTRFLDCSLKPVGGFLFGVDVFSGDELGVGFWDAFFGGGARRSKGGDALCF